MLQLHGMYENGQVALLEEVPIHKKTPVLITFIEEDSPDYSAFDELLGFCESTQTDASVKHDEIIYELGKKS